MGTGFSSCHLFAAILEQRQICVHLRITDYCQLWQGRELWRIGHSPIRLWSAEESEALLQVKSALSLELSLDEWRKRHLSRDLRSLQSLSNYFHNWGWWCCFTHWESYADKRQSGFLKGWHSKKTTVLSSDSPRANQCCFARETTVNLGWSSRLCSSVLPLQNVL